MAGTPKITVVIPAFRAATTIGKAVQSCLDESADIEIIVVVHGADMALQRMIPKADKVRVIVNPSTMGAPAARNIGLRAAGGEFVLFLDADDYVEGGLIGTLAQKAAASQADISFGSYAFELPSGRRIPVDIADTVGEPGMPGKSTYGISQCGAWYLCTGSIAKSGQPAFIEQSI